MAGFQPAQLRLDDDLDVDDWMAQRSADLERRTPDAAAIGSDAWSQSTRTGQNLSAVQPGDVVSLGALVPGQDGTPPQNDLQSASLRGETPLPLATAEPAIAPVTLADAGDLTSLPAAFRSATQFVTARPGDSISRLVGTSEPAAIGKFLTINGLNGRDSTLVAGQNYAIPHEFDDASPDEQAAGQRVLLADNAKLADLRARRSSEAARVSPAPAASSGSMGAASPASGGAIEYGALHANLPSDPELAELRRQQAAFSKTVGQIDIENSGYAIPALAPPLLALGLGGVAALGAEGVAAGVDGAVLDFLESDPYLRVGDNWATRAGRRVHAALKERLAQKPGWDYEPKIVRPGQRSLRPDVGTPPKDPKYPDERYFLEQKPNTPTGRTAAARSVKRYRDASGQKKVRAIYYNPGDFM